MSRNAQLELLDWLHVKLAPFEPVAAEMTPYVVMPQYWPSPVMNSMLVLDDTE